MAGGSVLSYTTAPKSSSSPIQKDRLLNLQFGTYNPNPQKSDALISKCLKNRPDSATPSTDLFRRAENLQNAPATVSLLERKCQDPRSEDVKLIEGLPVVSFHIGDKAQLISKVNFVIVAKFSHGRPTFRDFQAFLSSFKFRGQFVVSAFDRKHVFIEFVAFEDSVKLWMMKSCVVKGFKVRFFRWTESFSPTVEISIAPVWVSLPGLPLYFLEEKAMVSIASVLGKPLYIDPLNLTHQKVGAAWICVALDVSKSLPKAMWLHVMDEGKVIEQIHQRIVYHDLPTFCKGCYHLGHDVEHCKIKYGGNVTLQESLSVKKDNANPNSVIQETPTATYFINKTEPVLPVENLPSVSVGDLVVLEQKQKIVEAHAGAERLYVSLSDGDVQHESVSSTKDANESLDVVFVQEYSSEEEGEFIPFPNGREYSATHLTESGEGTNEKKAAVSREEATDDPARIQVMPDSLSPEAQNSQNDTTSIDRSEPRADVTLVTNSAVLEVCLPASAGKENSAASCASPSIPAKNSTHTTSPYLNKRDPGNMQDFIHTSEAVQIGRQMIEGVTHSPVQTDGNKTVAEEDRQDIIEHLAKIRKIYDQNNGTQGVVTYRSDIEQWIQMIFPKLNLPQHFAKNHNFMFYVDKLTDNMALEKMNDNLVGQLVDAISQIIFPSRKEEFLNHQGTELEENQAKEESWADMEEKGEEMDFSSSNPFATKAMEEDIKAPNRRGRPPKQKEDLPKNLPNQVPRKRGRPRKFT